MQKYTVQKFNRFTIGINGVELDVETDKDWRNDDADNQICKARFTLNGREFVIKLTEHTQISPKDVGIRAKKDARLYTALVKWGWKHGNQEQYHTEENFAFGDTFGDVFEQPAVKRAISRALAFAVDRSMI